MLVLDLSPGDVLHIPSGWWHQVRSLTASISARPAGLKSIWLDHLFTLVSYLGLCVIFSCLVCFRFGLFLISPGWVPLS